MRLKYTTRLGAFFLGSAEETYSCHIAVYDDESKKLISTNIRPEYELEGSDVEEIIQEIEEAIKRTWTTGDTRREMIDYLKEHQAEIELGNDTYELNTLVKKIEDMSSRVETLSKRILSATKVTDLASEHLAERSDRELAQGSKSNNKDTDEV